MNMNNKDNEIWFKKNGNRNNRVRQNKPDSERQVRSDMFSLMLNLVLNICVHKYIGHNSETTWKRGGINCKA